MKVKSYLLCIFLIGTVYPYSYKLTLADEHRGLFSVFFSVLGALDFYEKTSSWHGLEVDFEAKGLYHDATRGSNWWNYYFEPILLGDNYGFRKFFTSTEQAAFALHAAYTMPYTKGYELIHKYIKVRPHIQNKIDDYIVNHFAGNKVIGVHYRGTDKISEAPMVSYSVFINHLKIEIAKQDTIKIFVATDELNFLNAMHDNFPGKILSIETFRSTDGKPVHYSLALSPYQKGEDAVIDCILLSQCSKLYRTSSNLSAASMRFNPSMPEILLSKNGYERFIK